MKLCRFNDGRYGLVQGEQLWDVSPVLAPAVASGALFTELVRLTPAITDHAARAPAQLLSAVHLLSPVPRPGKIVAAPVNYINHLIEVKQSSEIHHGVQIEEIQRIGLFLKAPSSLIGPADQINLRFPDRRTDHEVELAVVIGKRANRVTREKALDHVAGYSIGLDITLRGPEERSFRKSIDTYTVIGPWIVTPEEFGDPGDANLSLSVNGQPRQDANTRDLILSVPALIEYASTFYTLEPGDILLTGTPEGVGPIAPGDMISAAIDRIGIMNIGVAAP
jgi:2-keto-4-pentenoate hydratase/2-oxohepta-3-ene-1,7-dioic acid hydratase in catechol pathway